MKTIYPNENNVVLDENSVERKPCINRESKRDELTIKLNTFHDINVQFLVVVTPPSDYQKLLKHYYNDNNISNHDNKNINNKYKNNDNKQ